MAQRFAGFSADDGYTTVLVPLGRAGVNLATSPAALTPEEARRILNLWMPSLGRWTGRPTLEFLGATPSAAEDVHTIQRLNLETGGYTRFWGAGGTLYRGQTPQLGVVSVDTGYSGDPLTLLRARPRRSGRSWMIVSDRQRIRQFSGDGGPYPLGMPAAPVGQSATLSEVLRQSIVNFDSSDGSAAANWTPAAGRDRSDTPRNAGVPTLANVAGKDGNALRLTTVVGDAQTGYSSLASLQVSRDLTRYPGGEPAGPDDQVHLYLRTDTPAAIEEIRLYLVCSDNFAAGVIPGTSPTANTDAFVKAFRPHDFTGFVEGLTDALVAGETSRERQAIEGDLTRPPFTQDPSPPPELLVADSLTGPLPGQTSSIGSTTGGTASGTTQTSQQLSPGRGAWTEFGVVGKPLRRIEWMRIGGDATAGWQSIRGIVILVQTTEAVPVEVTLDSWFLTGGYNLDSSDPEAQPYDWRYTHVHTLTGDEGNPSPVMAENIRVHALRQRVRLVPTALGDPLVRQRFYRRGGTVNDDWHYLGENTADGGAFTDNVPDDEAVAAPTLELDNFQPVATVDSNGNTVTVPLPILAGPMGGMVFGLGDPNRPGFLYWSKPERFGSWPPQNAREVCPPSEALQNLVLFGGEGFLFSRERMYRVTPNLTGDGSVSVQDTANAVGLAARWAICVGQDGIYYVARDGVRRTTGGASELISEQLRPLFFGEPSTEDLPPVDWAYPARIRLGTWQQHVLLQYRGTDGGSYVWVLNRTTGAWVRWEFPVPLACWAMEDQDAPGAPAVLGVGGAGNGAAWQLVRQQGGDELASGARQGVTWEIRTGDLDGGSPRDDKEMAEVAVEALIPVGAALGVEVKTDHQQGGYPQQVQLGDGTLRRYLFYPFGGTGGDPRPHRTVQLRLSGTASVGVFQPLDIRWASLTGRVISERVRERATTWETLGDGAEVYLTGVSLLVDTPAAAVQLQVWVRRGAVETLVDTLTLDLVGASRRRLQFSWPAVKADMVRLSPVPGGGEWYPFGVDWQFQQEPARVAGWDSNWENKGDTYYTGLDLECDTLGAEKQVEVWVDQQRLTNPATGLSYFPVVAQGRRLVHLTFGSGRGHLYRFVAVDANPGLLYTHEWQLAAEPAEQANWNEPYTVEGTLTDKYVKGVLVECDTFGQPKTLEIQIDGAVVATRTIVQQGRGVQHLSFPQALGRVLRLWPTDANPGRLYQRQWIFDEEPLQLARWETQLQDYGQGGWLTVLDGYVTYRTPVGVEGLLELHLYDQAGGLLTTLSQVLPASPAKRKAYLQVGAARAVLVKVVATAAQPFWLYREESRLQLSVWGSAEVLTVQPFGSDDLDKVRSLGRATAIAGTV